MHTWMDRGAWRTAVHKWEILDLDAYKGTRAHAYTDVACYMDLAIASSASCSDACRHPGPPAAAAPDDAEYRPAAHSVHAAVAVSA